MSDNRHNFIALDSASLKYTIWSGGDKIMLCFHGFGQDHSAFKSVYEAVKGTYTLYSFDAFFHGASEWQRGETPLLTEDWLGFMSAFLEKEQINSFEVMGFSMGGKFALTTAQLFPERTEHLHLLSPDGIKTHFSYRFSGWLIPFRKLFKAQIKNPTAFRRFALIAGKLKLINAYGIRFIDTQLDTEFKRRQTYYSWVVFRHFMPDLQEIASLINSGKAGLTFYLGKYDKVLNKEEMQHLIKLLNDYELIEVESGHSQLIEKVSEVL
jgi:pimeloyl-ACP methyl ester carboxylesterase